MKKRMRPPGLLPTRGRASRMRASLVRRWYGTPMSRSGRAATVTIAVRLMYSNHKSPFHGRGTSDGYPGTYYSTRTSSAVSHGLKSVDDVRNWLGSLLRVQANCHHFATTRTARVSHTTYRRPSSRGDRRKLRCVFLFVPFTSRQFGFEAEREQAAPLCSDSKPKGGCRRSEYERTTKGSSLFSAADRPVRSLCY
jgi:hypothetical protein